jgi:hypothetical protein
MPRAGAEQRASVRASVELEVHLARKVGRPVTVRTIDLGTGGARVTSVRPLRIDEQLHFDVDLPQGRPHLDGVARVLRQDRHDVYALRFEDVAPGTLAELRAFVDATAGAPVL